MSVDDDATVLQDGGTRRRLHHHAGVGYGSTVHNPGNTFATRVPVGRLALRPTVDLGVNRRPRLQARDSSGLSSLARVTIFGAQFLRLRKLSKAAGVCR
jgi:hypothetical protein